MNTRAASRYMEGVPVEGKPSDWNVRGMDFQRASLPLASAWVMTASLPRAHSLAHGMDIWRVECWYFLVRNKARRMKEWG